MVTGSALLLGCNINLAGAKITGNLDANVKVDNQGGIGNTTNNQGNNSGPGPGPVGLQDVKTILIKVVNGVETVAYGALPPWESDRRSYEGPFNPGGSGPTLFPTPSPVGTPYPMPSMAAKIDLSATVANSTQPVKIGPDDPNFAYSFEPNVPMTFDRGEGWLYPTQTTPPGDVTLKINWRGGVVSAKKTFRVVSGGMAAVEAE